MAASIPNQEILISTLGLQEAKDSSAIENIVTTHDELFREATYPGAVAGNAAKEVPRYRQALQAGFEAVQGTACSQQPHHQDPGGARAERRRLPEAAWDGVEGRRRRRIYTPPQDPGDHCR